MEVFMIETIAGLGFLLTLAAIGAGMYARGKEYEEIKRLKDVVAPREDDLKWSLKHTSVAYGIQNEIANK